MKQKFAFIVLIALLVSSMACSISSRDINFGFRTVKGSGTSDSETRALNDIQSVSLSGIGELNIQYGDEEQVLIEADDNILPLLTSEVRNGTLYLGVEDGVNIRPNNNVVFTLTLVEPLSSISVSGLGNVNAPDLVGDKTSLEISGSGDIQVESVDTRSLNVEISGLGSLSIASGEANEQTVSISGSGDYDAEDVKSNSASVHISGLGSASIWVTSQLEASISGSGNVKYYGSPTIKKDISGLGDLDSLGEH